MKSHALAYTLALSTLLAAVAPARAANIEEFRRTFAEAVHASSPDLVHQRNPQPLLRAVVVLNIKLGEDGHWVTDVMRTNDQQPDMLRRALDTVSRVRIDQIPEGLRDELRRNGFCETWLFDKDGSFQVKTLAKAQRSSF